MKKRSLIPQTKVKIQSQKKKMIIKLFSAWADRITFEEIREKLEKRVRRN